MEELFQKRKHKKARGCVCYLFLYIILVSGDLFEATDPDDKPKLEYNLEGKLVYFIFKIFLICRFAFFKFAETCIFAKKGDPILKA